MKHRMHSNRAIFAASLGLLFAPACLRSQTHVTSGQSAGASTSPPPATKIGGFKPAAGSLVTLGYDDLGSVGGVSVSVREMRDSRGRGR